MNSSFRYSLLLIVAVLTIGGSFFMLLNSGSLGSPAVSDEVGLAAGPRYCESTWNECNGNCECRDITRGYSTSFYSSSATVCQSSCKTYYGCGTIAGGTAYCGGRLNNNG